MNRSRVVGIVVAVAVIVAVFAVILPRFADYTQVWDEITAMDPLWVVALLAGEAANIATTGPPLMASMPGLSYGRSQVVTLVSTALSTIFPAGDAVSVPASYRMLRDVGFDTHRISAGLLLTGLWNQLFNVGLPVISVVLLALEGSRNRTLTVASAIGAAVLTVAVIGLVMVVRGDDQARRVGHWMESVINPIRCRIRGKAPIELGDTLVHFRWTMVEVLRNRWWPMTFHTALNQLTYFLVLLAALRGCGVSAEQVSLLEAVAAWSLTRLLTAIPITPGGIGLVEVGLTGLLVSFGGHNAAVVAAVLLYRTINLVGLLLVAAALSPLIRRLRSQVQTVS